jgi:hypothetical protein
MAIKKPDYRSRIILWTPDTRVETNGNVLLGIINIFHFLPPSMRATLLNSLTSAHLELVERDSQDE